MGERGRERGRGRGERERGRGRGVEERILYWTKRNIFENSETILHHQETKMVTHAVQLCKLHSRILWVHIELFESGYLLQINGLSLLLQMGGESREEIG